MSSSNKPYHAGKKRKFQKKNYRNPQRGGPGVLLTSEAGREHKCQVQGVDILNHYATHGDSDEGQDITPLNLEEELKMLKSQKAKGSSMFGVYETGCKGTVFVLCTIPECNLIPPIKIQGNKVAEGKSSGSRKQDADGSGDEGESEPKEKRTKQSDQGVAQQQPETTAPTQGVENKASGSQKQDADGSGDDGEEGESEPKEKPTKQSDQGVAQKQPETTVPTQGEKCNDPPWDPIGTVRHIVSDLEKNSKTVLSSRFVTRMIPIQATCFASVEELRSTSQALIKKYLPPATKTFAISAKRRMCDNITRGQIIDTVAQLVLDEIPECKVQLENPEVTVVVEICKTMCGVSVVQRCEEFRNFNLVTARERKDD
jgi:tRNA(Ser,Leu) C12 N-acetylase TAN1